MGGVMKSATNMVVGLAKNVIGGDSAPAGQVQVASNGYSSTAKEVTPSYAPPQELRGTQQDAQNAIDFQNNASRRKASGSGAQMLASSGTTGSNAGTKTLLGS